MFSHVTSWPREQSRRESVPVPNMSFKDSLQVSVCPVAPLWPPCEESGWASLLVQEEDEGNTEQNRSAQAHLRATKGDSQYQQSFPAKTSHDQLTHT